MREESKTEMQCVLSAMQVYRDDTAVLVLLSQALKPSKIPLSGKCLEKLFHSGVSCALF